MGEKEDRGPFYTQKGAGVIWGKSKLYETLETVCKCYTFTNLFVTRNTELEMTGGWMSHNRVTVPMVLRLQAPGQAFELHRQSQPAVSLEL